MTRKAEARLSGWWYLCFDIRSGPASAGSGNLGRTAQGALEGTTFADAIRNDNSNHHLWQNGRLWWVAFTIHRPDWTKHRVRLSLRTDDLEEARRRRDRILAAFGEREDCRLAVRLP